MLTSILHLPTDTWVKTSWETFTQIASNPQYQGKAYYYEGKAYLDMTPIGWNHAENNSVVSTLVVLFCALKNIPVKELTNCSFRKTGLQEAQPDIAFYLTTQIPSRSNSPVDLDQCPPPELVVELSVSSLSTDLGEKRLLYEQMGVREYWVIDATQGEITIFAMENRGSRQTPTSVVLPDLTIDLIETTLKRSKQEDHGALARWLLASLD